MSSYIDDAASRDLTIEEIDALLEQQPTAPRFLVPQPDGSPAPAPKPADEIEGPTFFTLEDWEEVREQRQPELIAIEGGAPLLYAGESHLLFGHGGDGKSFVLAHCLAELLRAGETVLWIDYESDKLVLRDRLRGLGVTAEQAYRCAYWRVGGQLGGARPSGWDVRLAEFLETYRPTLTVLDSIGRAMNAVGLDESSNAEAGVWWARLVRKQFELRSLAFVGVMHLGHETDSNRSRLAPRGASSFLHVITGAAYRLDVVEPFSQAQSGQLKATAAKDRVGARAKGELVCLIDVEVTSETVELEDGTTRVVGDVTGMRLHAPAPGAPAPKASGLRPTTLMEKASKLLERLGEGKTATKTALRELGKAEHVDRACELLVAEGFATFNPATRSEYRSLRPYRQCDDPQSDRYVPKGEDGRFDEPF